MGMAAADDQFHVLAVDDSLIDRKLIERLLKTSSFQVTTVDSGSKALEFLGWHEEEEEEDEEIDMCSNDTSLSPKNHHEEVEVNLVITDYCMPGMTGYDLLRKIKESSLLRDIPVVIMSSENVPSRINRCLEEGAEEFFLKPVKKSDVSKLMPHMIKTKSKKDVVIQTEKEEEVVVISTRKDSDMEQIPIPIPIQIQTAESLQQETIATNSKDEEEEEEENNKRKSMDEEGLSPDRNRPRYTDFTLLTN